MFRFEYDSAVFIEDQRTLEAAMTKDPKVQKALRVRYGGFEYTSPHLKRQYFQGFTDFIDKFIDKFFRILYTSSALS